MLYAVYKGIISTAQISLNNTNSSTGKRLITEKIAESLTRFRDIETRLDTTSELIQGQYSDLVDLNGAVSEDEASDEDEDDEYAILSNIKIDSGLLKTTNVKSNFNGVGSHNGLSVNGPNADTNDHHLNNKEIWLEYGCI